MTDVWESVGTVSKGVNMGVGILGGMADVWESVGTVRSC